MNINYSAFPQLANTTRKTLTNDISGKTTYRINKDGFRGEDFDDNVSIIALGCSVTFGIGVHQEDSWPSILGKKLNKTVANISRPAGGPDTCFRFASHWIPTLKPKTLVYLEPPPGRFELLKNDMTKSGLYAGYLFYSSKKDTPINDYVIMNAMLRNDLNFELNYLKNALAIEQLCNNNGCDFYYFKCGDHYLDPDGELGFDDHHPGPSQHKKFVDVILDKING